MKLLLLGGNGQVGRELRRSLLALGEVVVATRDGIGADAIVGAGSAVSRDVADGELRLVRGEQLVKPGWADRFHDLMKKKKAEKAS